jgi:hypothetical protein
MFYIQLQISCRDWINGMNMHVCMYYVRMYLSITNGPGIDQMIQIIYSQICTVRSTVIQAEAENRSTTEPLHKTATMRIVHTISIAGI